MIYQVQGRTRRVLPLIPKREGVEGFAYFHFIGNRRRPKPGSGARMPPPGRGLRWALTKCPKLVRQIAGVLAGVMLMGLLSALGPEGGD